MGICGLAVIAGVWLWAKETEISAALWVHEAHRGLYSCFYSFFYTSAVNVVLSLWCSDTTRSTDL